MEVYNFLRKKYSIPPEKSLNEFCTPTFADWSSLVKLLEEYSCQIEPQVMEIIDKAIKNEETAIKMNRLTNNMRGTVNYCLVRLNAIKAELSNLSL